MRDSLNVRCGPDRTICTHVTHACSYKCAQSNKLFCRQINMLCEGLRQFGNGQSLLTAIYGLQPASWVFAIESTNWPLMPKSHILMFPSLSTRIFDGFTSVKELRTRTNSYSRIGMDHDKVQLWLSALLKFCSIFYRHLEKIKDFRRSSTECVTSQNKRYLYMSTFEKDMRSLHHLREN